MLRIFASSWPSGRIKENLGIFPASRDHVAERLLLRPPRPVDRRPCRDLSPGILSARHPHGTGFQE